MFLAKIKLGWGNNFLTFASGKDVLKDATAVNVVKSEAICSANKLF